MSCMPCKHLTLNIDMEQALGPLKEPMGETEGGREGGAMLTS